MRGNNYQIIANQVQDQQFRLSMDLPILPIKNKYTATVNPDECLGVPIWECLKVKYLDNPRRRAILGALGVMAGYQVN